MADPLPRPKIFVPLVIVVAALAIRFVPSWVAPFTTAHFLGLGLGPLIGLVALIVWWGFARRARWRDRGIGVASAIAVFVVILLAADRTMPTALALTGLPIVLLLVAIGLIVTRSWPWSRARFVLAAALALGLGPMLLLRMDGQGGDLRPELSLRWTPSAEDRFLAEATPSRSGHLASIDWSEVEPSWPGFRGPRRDGIVERARFATDWDREPPRQLWRRAVGPGWSSFAVAGGVAFTQEQRGDRESVVAYDLESGDELWIFGADERFEEPQAGPGPRATPTFDRGGIFALTAGGTLLALDAASGAETLEPLPRRRTRGARPGLGLFQLPTRRR